MCYDCYLKFILYHINDKSNAFFFFHKSMSSELSYTVVFDCNQISIIKYLLAGNFSSADIFQKNFAVVCQHFPKLTF